MLRELVEMCGMNGTLATMFKEKFQTKVRIVVCLFFLMFVISITSMIISIVALTKVYKPQVVVSGKHLQEFESWIQSNNPTCFRK